MIGYDWSIAAARPRPPSSLGANIEANLAHGTSKGHIGRWLVGQRMQKPEPNESQAVLKKSMPNQPFTLGTAQQLL